MWTARVDLNLHTSGCNFVKKIPPPINVKYHENWLLAMSTTNYIETTLRRGELSKWRSAPGRFQAVFRKLTVHNFCQIVDSCAENNEKFHLSSRIWTPSLSFNAQNIFVMSQRQALRVRTIFHALGLPIPFGLHSSIGGMSVQRRLELKSCLRQQIFIVLTIVRFTWIKAGYNLSFIIPN